MANDQHKDPGYEDRIAVAPYNFVPLPPRAITDSAPKGPGGPVVRRPLSHDRYWDKDELGEPVYSGQFECELTTDTLLYIRGVLSEDDARKGKDVKETPEPYAIAGRPGIPGSSLRGMFRELVEIASFSKMSEVTSQKQVYRAVDVSSLGIKYRGRIMEEIERNVFVPRIKAGYIRRHENQWFIQPAEEIGGTTWCRIGERYIPSGLGAWPPQEVQEAQHVDGDPKVYNARTIYIQPGPYQFQEVKGGFLKIKYSRAQRASANPGEGLRPAALAISGKMTSKRSEAIILQPDPKRAAPDEWLPLRYKDEELEVMLDRAYEDQVTDQQAVILGNPQLEHGKQDRRGALRDLQPVFYLIENGKLVFFGHTLMMRLPYLHSPLDLVPAELRREEERDLAQAIFGYADKPVKDHASFAGRVFFSDAMLVGDPASAYAARDPIKPKVLSTPKPTTFQHYLTQSEPDNPASLSDYDDATTIRGHKLYWHRGAVGMQDIEERDAIKLKHRSQYTSIRPIKAGAVFQFTLRFENLRETELGALAWVLRVASDPACRLKLGMGKPLGMGAVKIDSTLRLSDREARYRGVFAGSAWRLGERSQEEASSVLSLSTRAFEQWVLGDSGINRGSVKQLADLPRIQELLKLLSWPGPDRKHTRYMEIEHYDERGRRYNEYRSRPVLPKPTAVGTDAPKGANAPDVRPSVRQQPLPPRPVVPPPARPMTPPKIEPLPEVRETASDEAKMLAAKMAHGASVNEGDEFEVEILRVNANEYECRLGQGIKTPGKLARDEKRDLKAGDKLKAKVKRVANSGAAILTLRGVKQ